LVPCAFYADPDPVKKHDACLDTGPAHEKMLRTFRDIVIKGTISPVIIVIKWKLSPVRVYFDVYKIKPNALSIYRTGYCF
jgi:hypothetical protein